MLEVQVLSSHLNLCLVCRHGAIWQTRQSQKLHCEGSSPSACIGNLKFVGVAQFGRRAGLRSRLLKVQVLSPTSVFRRRSSIGRARACQARGREFEPPRRLQITARLAEWIQAQGCKPCQGGSIPSACSNFQRAEVAQSADARSLNLRNFEGSTPSFGMSIFCG